MLKKMRKITMRYLNKWRHLSRRSQAIVLVISFVIVGSLLLLVTNALTNTADFEPESGSLNGVCVRDDSAASGGEAIEFTGGSCAISIVPQTLATNIGHTGTAFTANLGLSSGDLANWSITSGQLPPGISLSGNQLRGTPTVAGAYTFRVHAVFNFIGQRDKDYTILIYPPTSTGYDTRIATTVNAHVNGPWPPMSGGSDCINTVGVVTYSMANLWLNKNVTAVNDRLVNTNIASLNCGSSGQAIDTLWFNHLMRLYLLYNANSTYFPGRLRTDADRHIIEGIWNFMKAHAEFDRSSLSNSSIWLGSSENHQAQTNTDMFLASQILKNDPAYATRRYDDGHSPTEYYNAYRAFWSKWFDERAKRGLWVEVGSGYHGYTMDGIFNMYNFAEDPMIRTKAEMIIDLDFADVAQQDFNNNHGGGKSRIYKDDGDNFDGLNSSIGQIARVILGPGQQGVGNHVLFPATSGYYPPQVIADLAHTTNKGNYEYVTRRPGVGVRSALDPSQSVLHYSYVTPNYILGTAILDRNEDYSAASGQNRWQGIIFNTTSDARVFTQVGPVDHTNTTQNGFYAVQKKGAMLTHKIGYDTLTTQIYFAQSLDQIDEDSGWLFVREGGSYLAVRPQTGSYSWLDPAKNNATDRSKRFIRLSDNLTPIIFEAANASDYGNNFTNFKNNIKDNARSYVSGVMNYTASDGTRLTLYDSRTTPQINGGNVNFAPINVFGSVYMGSLWGSGKIDIQYGSHNASYDFSNTNNPIKTER